MWEGLESLKLHEIATFGFKSKASKSGKGGKKKDTKETKETKESQTWLFHVFSLK